MTGTIDAAPKKIGRIKDHEGVTTLDSFMIDPDVIVFEEGYNVRDYDSVDNAPHIRQLADSIKEVGVLNPLIVRWRNSKIYLVEGHCRIMAIRLAKSEGCEIKKVRAVQEQAGMNDDDRIVSLFIRNSGKPLNALEQGKVFSRLLGLGWTEAQIARKCGLSAGHVGNILSLHEAPHAVRELVANGSVAPTLAITSMRDHGPEEAVTVLTGAIEAAKANGKSRATAKDVAATRDAAPTKPRAEKRDWKAFAVDTRSLLNEILDTSHDHHIHVIIQNFLESNGMDQE